MKCRESILAKHCAFLVLKAWYLHQGLSHERIRIRYLKSLTSPEVWGIDNDTNISSIWEPGNKCLPFDNHTWQLQILNDSFQWEVFHVPCLITSG